MDCCEKKPWKVKALPLLVALAIIAGVVVASFFTRPAEHDETSEEARFRLVFRQPERLPVGDMAHGSALYAMHCASCHGMKGDGTGPAADYLWPLPRDHRDAAYMLSRTDDLLYKAVAQGVEEPLLHGKFDGVTTIAAYDSVPTSVVEFG